MWVCTQPWPGSQASSVQGFSSSQSPGPVHTVGELCRNMNALMYLPLYAVVPSKLTVNRKKPSLPAEMLVKRAT